MAAAKIERGEMNDELEHTAECYAMPDCAVCGLPKKPIGRDTLVSGYCDSDCPGYRQDPQPGHLWPDEAIGYSVKWLKSLGCGTLPKYQSIRVLISSARVSV